MCKTATKDVCYCRIGAKGEEGKYYLHFLLFLKKRFVFDRGPFLKSLLNLLQHCFCYNIASVVCFVLGGPKVCGILAPQPGIEPAPPALEGEVLTTGPPEKFLTIIFEW